MDWLNYHHLYYFWTVAKEGSITRAGEKLRLTQPTISGQLRLFEDSLGEKLFTKAGRRLVLTDTGQVVFRYAEEIFSTGHELMDVLRGRGRGKPARLLVGISDVLPKFIAFRILQPVRKLPEPVQLICHEDRTEGLLAKLAAHELDVVLTESPLGTMRVRAFSHLLGSCGVSFCAAPALAKEILKTGFPAGLDGAPFLMPLEGSTLRRSLDQWLDRQGVRPIVVGEFQDSALMKVFGQAGEGVFASPTAVEAEVTQLYNVRVVGRTEGMIERFYAISVERRLKNPAIVAICEAARNELFEAEEK